MDNTWPQRPKTILSLPGEFLRKEKYYPYGRYNQLLKPGMYFILKTDDPEVFEFVIIPGYHEEWYGLSFQEFHEKMDEECQGRRIATCPIGFRYAGFC